MLAREAEAASWSQRRQMYTGGGGGGGCKREIGGGGPWLAVAPPTMGFPPMAPLQHPHFRPLHVWGHPPTNQPLVHIWPKHVVLPHPPPVPPPPHPSLPPPDPSFWHTHPQRVISFSLSLNYKVNICFNYFETVTFFNLQFYSCQFCFKRKKKQLKYINH